MNTPIHNVDELLKPRMQRVINFSGGKTSAYMTISEYKSGDIVLFCDTGREHPKTYKFINDFEAHENIPVIRLQHEGGFEGMLKKFGNGKYGKKIPNRGMRECTFELKIRTARRYMRSLGFMKYENLIGFRSDEQKRVFAHKEKWQQVKTVFPLYENGVTKAMINEFWSKKPYNLEIPSVLGNCDLCFMKGKAAIIAILSHFPELADKWIADEEASKQYFGHTYVKGITMREMQQVAKENVSVKYDLDKIESAYSCACTT